MDNIKWDMKFIQDFQLKTVDPQILKGPEGEMGINCALKLFTPIYKYLNTLLFPIDLSLTLQILDEALIHQLQLTLAALAPVLLLQECSNLTTQHFPATSRFFHVKCGILFHCLGAQHTLNLKTWLKGISLLHKQVWSGKVYGS